MARILGILGALAAALYVIYVDPSRVPATLVWSTRVPLLLIYIAFGFCVGWLLGFAISTFGGDR